MTERLPEKQQCGIYEWRYPELRKMPWRFGTVADTGNLIATWTVRRPTGKHTTEVVLQPLYMPDGKENWNFVRECVERLHKEDVSVTFVFDNCGAEWYLRGKFVGTVNPAFFVALSELLESK